MFWYQKIFIILLSLCMISKSAAREHRAHLQGWYPTEPEKLTESLAHLFAKASTQYKSPVDPQAIRALVVPHAGMQFSGLAAAAVYQLLMQRKDIERVIILAPSHFEPFYGIALPDFDTYRMPTGVLRVDKDAIERLSDCMHCSVNPQAFAPEHALEMQLPYIIAVLRTPLIVPLIVGNISQDQAREIASTIAQLWNAKTILVVSSDLTHYGKKFNYTPFNFPRFKDHISEHVIQRDTQFIEKIKESDLEKYIAFLKQTQITVCGREPLKILLALHEHENEDITWRTSVAAYYMSAQLGNKTSLQASEQDIFSYPSDEAMQHSVSYAGMIISNDSLQKNKREFTNFLTTYEQESLLHAARCAIEYALVFGKDKSDEVRIPIISTNTSAPFGVFVTLRTKKDKALRGCIGHIVSDEPLYKTTLAMARAAAFDDPRFPPVTKAELDQCLIEVDILEKPYPVASYRDIKIGEHGIILKKMDGRKLKSALFLPEVAPEFGWTLSQTLEQLSLKAGLARDAWKDASYELFRAFKF